MKIPLVISLCFLMSIGSLTSFAQSLTQEQISSIENAIEEEMKTARTPGVELAIIKDNDVVFERSFGLSNLLTKVAVTDTTIFQIASVTKIFTALTILTELNNANIGLYEPVGKIVKGLSPKVSSITFHQLLSHTSGIIDYEDRTDLSTVPDFFQKAGDSVLFTEPGKVFSYSNTGYALLSMAIEQLAGKPYAEAVENAVIKPLKLKNTTFDFYKVACRSFSAGHYYNSRIQIIMPSINNYEMPLLQSAGGLFSNIQDLERLALCLLNNGKVDDEQVFESDIIEKMQLRHAEDFMASAPSYFGFLNYPNNAYGYGIFMFDYGDLHFVGNAGAGTNMTYLLVEPETKFAMILSSNLAWDILVNSFKKIWEVVLGEQEPMNSDIEVDRNEWREITGEYYLPAIDKNRIRSVNISENENKLYINFDGRGKVLLEQIGEMAYSYSTPGFRLPIEISFYRDDSNRVAYLRNIWRTWLKIE